MALNRILDSRDLRFILFDQLKIQNLTSYEAFKDMDREIFEATLDLAEQIAIEKLYDANIKGDRTGVTYDPEKRTVTTPAEYKGGMQAINEAGFVSISNDPRWGGMGMPDPVWKGCLEYAAASGIPLSMYLTLNLGVINLIRRHGPADLQNTYLEKMVMGEWSGTMCLTEPTAGTDVGALKTKAVKQDDGTYRITGNKIFITCGDTDLYENVVHAVLARVEGAPAGTRGISIFIVPKFLPDGDGRPGKSNDVVCTGIEHKMGLHGSPTCSLSFGDNGDCVGYLLGDECQGMGIMFEMMNEARLDVAYQGLGVSSAAYMHAATYAKGRIQGKGPRPGDGQVTIINHPDVQRMLLGMKSTIEAMRALNYYCSLQYDLMHVGSGEEKQEAEAMLDFLIPQCKAGCTDQSWLITGEAMQVYGGYGYCSEYPVEQYARDSKILSIYEGTNGIQSLDLLIRKLLKNPDMNNYRIYKKRIRATIDTATGIADEKHLAVVREALGQMDEVVQHLSGELAAGRQAEVLAQAVPVQQAFTMLSYAWMHLQQLQLTIPESKRLLGDATGQERSRILQDSEAAAFAYGKTLSGAWFLDTRMPAFAGMCRIIVQGCPAVTDAEEAVFSGTPAP